MIVSLKAVDLRPFLNRNIERTLIDDIDNYGEYESDLLRDFIAIDTRFADDEESDMDIEKFLNSLELADANSKSSQDTAIYKVRYQYKVTSSDTVKGGSRPLCKKLSNNLIYRKEEILNLSSKGGAQDKGQSYDVFLYKGGANCKHGWKRTIYRKRLKKDGTPWGGGAMTGVEKTKFFQAIKGGARINNKADKKAVEAPRDTPTKGYKK